MRRAPPVANLEMARRKRTFWSFEKGPRENGGGRRVSKADGSQSLDLQRDELRAAGVDGGHVHRDFADGRPAASGASNAL